MYTEVRAQPLLERQGSPWVAVGAGPCNREQVPRRRDVRWQKAQTALQSPGTTGFSRTLTLPEPFPRARGQRLPAATNTHKDRTRAGLRHPARQARRASARERRDTTPPKTGRRSLPTRRQSSPHRFSAAFLRRWGLGRCSGWKVGGGDSERVVELRLHHQSPFCT